ADRLEAVPLAQQRPCEAVLAVQGEPHVIALHAEQPLVDLRLAIPGDGHDLAVLHAHLDVTPGAAETTGRLVPGDAGGGGEGVRLRGILAQRQSGGGYRRARHGRVLDELSPLHPHPSSWLGSPTESADAGSPSSSSSLMSTLTTSTNRTPGCVNRSSMSSTPSRARRVSAVRGRWFPVGSPRVSRSSARRAASAARRRSGSLSKVMTN